MINRSSPLVTIGIPLFNEENYIEDTVRSAVGQCATVCISDNASTDGSAKICELLSKEYININLIHQPINIGSVANFEYLLDKADTPFFMWLGAHDILPKGYVEQLVHLLLENPEAVLAYGASRYIDLNGKPCGHHNTSFSALLADKTPAIRVLGLIEHLHDCSLIHGVFRTEPLREAWNAVGQGIFLGMDHLLMAHAVSKGEFLYNPEIYLIRRNAHPTDTMQEQLKRMNSHEPNKEQLTYFELKQREYALASKVFNKVGLRGIFYRLKARYFLVKRFGPLQETSVGCNVDTVYILVAKGLSLISRIYKVIHKGFFYLGRKLKSPLSAQVKKFSTINAIRRSGSDHKIIVGAASTKQKGWISTNYPLLDLTDKDTFDALFIPGSVCNFLAEHVWEHLTIEDGSNALRNCFDYLKSGGRLRIAVPDGYHPDPDYIAQVKPDGYGYGAEDHKVLYIYKTLSDELIKAGYEVKLLEWFDEHGDFHYIDWSADEGMIERSMRFDSRNKTNPTTYTSLIVDAVKP